MNLISCISAEQCFSNFTGSVSRVKSDTHAWRSHAVVPWCRHARSIFRTMDWIWRFAARSGLVMSDSILDVRDARGGARYSFEASMIGMDTGEFDEFSELDKREPELRSMFV